MANCPVEARLPKSQSAVIVWMEVALLRLHLVVATQRLGVHIKYPRLHKAC